jgi:hypothetical protein
MTLLDCTLLAAHVPTQLWQEQAAQDRKEEQEREAKLAQKGFKGFSPRLLSTSNDTDESD